MCCPPARHHSADVKISENDCKADTIAKRNFNKSSAYIVLLDCLCMHKKTLKLFCPYRVVAMPVSVQVYRCTGLHTTFLIHTFLFFVDEISLMKLS